MSVLRYHVPRIVQFRSNKQMVRIDTTRVIALVEYALIFRDRSLVDKVGKPVRRDLLSSLRDFDFPVALAGLCAEPFPTSGHVILSPLVVEAPHPLRGNFHVTPTVHKHSRYDMVRIF